MESNDTIEKRGRGVLSAADRRYLMSPEEFGSAAAYERREAIRDRVTNATKDLRILANHLDDEKMEEIFSREVKTVETDDGFTSVLEGEIEVKHLVAGYAFLAFASIKNDFDVNTEGLKPEVLQFHGVQSLLDSAGDDMERGLEAMLNNRYDLIADIDVSVSTNHLSTKEGYGEAVEERVEQKDEPIRGKERIREVDRLLSAGYSDEEILEILGPAEPDDEDIPDEKVDMDDLVPDHAVIDEEDDETDEDE